MYHSFGRSREGLSVGAPGPRVRTHARGWVLSRAPVRMSSPRPRLRTIVPAPRGKGRAPYGQWGLRGFLALLPPRWSLACGGRSRGMGAWVWLGYGAGRGFDVMITQRSRFSAAGNSLSARAGGVVDQMSGLPECSKVRKNQRPDWQRCWSRPVVPACAGVVPIRASPTQPPPDHLSPNRTHSPPDRSSR